MPLPVLTVAQMRDWEAATWMAGRTPAEIIDNVGRAVAMEVMNLTREGARVVVLAGKGNNGEDARKAASHIERRKVTLIDAHDPVKALADFQEASGERPECIVDGLFGIGLNRQLDEEWVGLIEAVNNCPARVLSIDLPSGLDADTGQPWGAAIQADVTLTVGAPKAGLLAPEAWPFTGSVRVAAEVGLAACPAPGELQWIWPQTDFAGLPPKRSAAGHKGTYGHVGIMAGSLGYHGAAVLAARAAQRAQPGLVTLHTADAVYTPVAAQLQAVMVSAWRAGFKVPLNYTAYLLGPGLAAPEMRDLAAPVLRQLWRDCVEPVVVDASGLDLLPMDPPARAGLKVLTPHPGEAARLLRRSVEQVQSNRLASLRAISKAYGNCWVVLKGHLTLIGRSTGEVFVNGSGNAHLAQGGSGDVLSGFIAGLLAQSAWAKDPGKTLCYAVAMHGAAADMLQRQRQNWTVEDLVRELGASSCEA